MNQFHPMQLVNNLIFDLNTILVQFVSLHFILFLLLLSLFRFHLLISKLLLLATLVKKGKVE